MSDSDMVGHTRDGTRWELVFAGDHGVVTADRLRDVCRLISVHAEILDDHHSCGESGSQSMADVGAALDRVDGS